MIFSTRPWTEGLAEDLQDKDFAQGFVLAALEEGISIQEILGTVIRAIGIKKFSKLAKMSSSNIVRVLRKSHNPTQRTLDRLLAPLGLRLTVAPIRRKRSA